MLQKWKQSKQRRISKISEMLACEVELLISIGTQLLCFRNQQTEHIWDARFLILAGAFPCLDNWMNTPPTKWQTVMPSALCDNELLLL